MINDDVLNKSSTTTPCSSTIVLYKKLNQLLFFYFRKWVKNLLFLSILKMAEFWVRKNPNP